MEENIRFGQRYSAAAPPPMAPLIARLGLERLLGRRIQSLSGGEKQRVALARALAVAPSVLLLDEPLTALDPNFREDIRGLIKGLHRDTGITLLMVTHDFGEAHFLAQRAAVMNRGRIEQIGLVEKVFAHPETPFVAGFVGMKNLFLADVGEEWADIGGVRLRCGASRRGRYWLAIRPENVAVSRRLPGEGAVNRLQGRVCGILNRGFYADVRVAVNGLMLHAIDSRRELTRARLTEGDALHLAIAPEDIHLIRAN